MQGYYFVWVRPSYGNSRSPTYMNRREQPFKNPIYNDFKVFLYVTWKHLSLPEPTRVQYQIADYLQYGPKRSIIEGFRGVGKSWITAAFVIWLLLRDPQERIMVVSASKQRADDFTTFVLRVIKEMPMLAHLIPKPDQRESKISFDVAPARAAQSASVFSKGVTSQITGGRATRIISDDCEIPNNSATQEARDKLIHTISEFNAILVPEGDTSITYLGTPQTEETVYTKLSEFHDYSIRIWPARYPTLEECRGKYNNNISPVLVRDLEKDPGLAGKPTDPARFDNEDLEEREGSYGKSQFALQFMLDTELSDANRYPLRLEDFIVFQAGLTKSPVGFQYGSSPAQRLKLPSVGFSGDYWYGPIWFDNEKWTEYEGIILSVDPAGRGKDRTGYAVVGHLMGNLFVLDAGSLDGGYDKTTLVALANVAKKWEVHEVVAEANFGKPLPK